MQYQRPGKHDTLKQCWASLADGGPALSQPWFNVPCLLGCDLSLKLQNQLCKARNRRVLVY